MKLESHLSRLHARQPTVDHGGSLDRRQWFNSVVYHGAEHLDPFHSSHSVLIFPAIVCGDESVIDKCPVRWTGGYSIDGNP